jgi:hypothetical protein
MVRRCFQQVCRSARSFLADSRVERGQTEPTGDALKTVGSNLAPGNRDFSSIVNENTRFIVYILFSSMLHDLERIKTITLYICTCTEPGFAVRNRPSGPEKSGAVRALYQFLDVRMIFRSIF